MYADRSLIECPRAKSYLQIIGEGNLVDRTPIRRFLFEETQHQIGGFGKYPGNPPGTLATSTRDIYTSVPIMF
jgi:hypothetical protein